jgi:hypothetical protein
MARIARVTLRDSPDVLVSAVSYYADYPDEIDEWSRRNRDEAERLQAAHEREQAALSR